MSQPADNASAPSASLAQLLTGCTCCDPLGNLPITAVDEASGGGVFCQCGLTLTLPDYQGVVQTFAVCKYLILSYAISAYDGREAQLLYCCQNSKATMSKLVSWTCPAVEEYYTSSGLSVADVANYTVGILANHAHCACSSEGICSSQLYHTRGVLASTTC